MRSIDTIAAAVVDVALIAAVVALALAHVISGPAALALLPYFALRARRPPTGPRAAGDDEQLDERRRPVGRGRRLARIAVEAFGLAVLRFFDPLAELHGPVEGARWAVRAVRDAIARRRARASDPGGLPTVAGGGP